MKVMKQFFRSAVVGVCIGFAGLPVALAEQPVTTGDVDIPVAELELRPRDLVPLLRPAARSRRSEPQGQQAQLTWLQRRPLQQLQTPQR